jgi:ABC-type uncharacterized transport system permease subunit
MFDRVGGALSARAEGVVLPIGTTVLAFVVGGLAVLAAGHNPLSAYNAIFKGTGLNYVLPWTSSTDKIFAAINLQQTLIETTPLILTALAVAFSGSGSISPACPGRCTCSWRCSRRSSAARSGAGSPAG